MIGFIIVAHNQLGKEALKTVQAITQENIHIVSVDVDIDAPVQHYQAALKKALENLKAYQGVIILTDLFGATPSNLCHDYLAQDKVTMITGCNIPILLKAATTKFDMPLGEVTKFLEQYGKENIRIESGSA